MSVPAASDAAAPRSASAPPLWCNLTGPTTVALSAVPKVLAVARKLDPEAVMPNPMSALATPAVLAAVSNLPARYATRSFRLLSDLKCAASLQPLYPVPDKV